MYATRAKTPHQLGDRPLVILLPKAGYGSAPTGVSAEEWKRFNEEKRQQKLDLTSLSRNSKVIVAENSSHHIQLDEPQVVTEAIRLVVDSVRRHTKLSPSTQMWVSGFIDDIRSFLFIRWFRREGFQLPEANWSVS